MTAILICLMSALTAQEEVSLHIIEGAVSDDNQWMPYFVFSETETFDSSNAILRFDVGTTVEFSITNHADFTCGFRIKDHGSIETIATGETKTLTVDFNTEGSFLYEDHTQDHRALGLGSMIVVSDFSGPSYYGVFTEHCLDWITPIADGGPYDKRTYNPDAFTINGKGFPRTLHDSLAMIKGSVGDTIRIYMTNAGLMYHFPHFHGYHVKIIQSDQHPHYVGWMKDSFGMAPGESVCVELVPDKPGHFPMHNHNLVTTTVGGNYPGGMMMHMEIDE